MEMISKYVKHSIISLTEYKLNSLIFFTIGNQIDHEKP